VQLRLSLFHVLQLLWLSAYLLLRPVTGANIPPVHMTHRLRNVPRGLFLENDDTQSRVNSDSNLSQNRLKRTMRQASWTKPRKLWAWYSLSFPKIISARSDDAIRTRLV
jgi:hypothetical protein